MARVYHKPEAGGCGDMGDVARGDRRIYENGKEGCRGSFGGGVAGVLR